MVPSPAPGPLTPGLELQVEIPEGKFAGLYFSAVQALTAAELLIAPPSVGPMLVPVTAGMKAVIHFKEGKIACSFATKLTPLKDPRGNPYCAVPRPAQITRVQRRRFVRVPTDSPVTFRIVKGTKTTGPQAGTLLDVSGAGARIGGPFDPELAAGRRVILEFTLEAIKTDLEGIIGEIIKAEPKPEGRLEFSVKFTGLTETDRQHLIRFVFQRQFQQKRKG